MSRKNILITGTSFAEITGALELKESLGNLNNASHAGPWLATSLSLA